MKIVINKCWGGYGLSALAISELNPEGCYFFKHEDKLGFGNKYVPITLEEAEGCFMWVAFRVPNPNDYHLSERDENGSYLTSNESYDSIKVNEGEDRTDPKLIEVIERLGTKANSRYSKLKVIEIPDGISYCIGEYDGMEHIAEDHRTWG